MKTKLSTLALFAGICLSASAVTISWNSTAAQAQIFGLTSGTAMTVGDPSQTASMVVYYFDYADYDTIVAKGAVEASELSSFVVASAAGQTSTSTSAAGRLKASTTNKDYTTSGNSFFARAYATFDGKTYFIDLFGGNGTGGVWTMGSSGDDRTTEKFSWVQGTSAATSPYGGSTSTAVGTKNSWVAVPEPGTASLALAGLALLLKRRKA